MVEEAQIVLVVEGTAMTGLYLQELLSTYVIPLLEQLTQLSLKEYNDFTENPNIWCGLVIYHASDQHRGLSPESYGPFSNPYKLIYLLQNYEFTGGRTETSAHIAAGLATALHCFENFQNKKEIDSKPEKYCILICNPPPYEMGLEFPGKTASELAAMLNDREIKLSILAPRRIPALFNLFEMAGGNVQENLIKSSAKDPRHMVLLQGFSLGDQLLGSVGLCAEQLPQCTPQDTTPAQKKENSELVTFPAQKKENCELVTLPAQKKENCELVTLPAQKNENSELVTLPAQKTENSELVTLPAQKTENSELVTLPAQKNENSELVTLPAQKNENSELVTLPAQKKENSELVTLPAQKKENSELVTLPAQKNENSELVTFPAQKKENSELVTSSVQPLTCRKNMETSVVNQVKSSVKTTRIWEGYLEWFDKLKNDKKVVQSLPCYMSTRAPDTLKSLSPSFFPKLTLQIIPKHFAAFIGMDILQNSRKVMVDFEECPLLEELISKFNSENIGYIEFENSRGSENISVKLMMIFFSQPKKTFFGVIPNDQLNFRLRLQKALYARGSNQRGQNRSESAVKFSDANNPTTDSFGSTAHQKNVSSLSENNILENKKDTCQQRQQTMNVPTVGPSNSVMKMDTSHANTLNQQHNIQLQQSQPSTVSQVMQMPPPQHPSCEFAASSNTAVENVSNKETSAVSQVKSNENRTVIWQGYIGWIDEIESGTRILHQLLCYMATSESDKLQPLNPRLWPKNLFLQIIHRQVATSVGDGILQNARKVMVHFAPSQLLVNLISKFDPGKEEKKCNMLLQQDLIFRNKVSIMVKILNLATSVFLLYVFVSYSC